MDKIFQKLNQLKLKEKKINLEEKQYNLMEINLMLLSNLTIIKKDLKKPGN